MREWPGPDRCFQGVLVGVELARSTTRCGRIAMKMLAIGFQYLTVMPANRFPAPTSPKFRRIHSWNKARMQIHNQTADVRKREHACALARDEGGALASTRTPRHASLRHT